MESKYPTGETALHVCLHGHVEGKATHAPIDVVDGALVVNVDNPLAPQPTLLPIDQLALAVSALADVSAIATSATELTAAEKNQLRAIFTARIRLLMTQV